MHRREITWEHREKGGHRRNQPCWLIELRFFSLQDSEEINYGGLRPPICGALLWRPEQTHTIMMMVVMIRKALDCETWGTLSCKWKALSHPSSPTSVWIQGREAGRHVVPGQGGQRVWTGAKTGGRKGVQISRTLEVDTEDGRCGHSDDSGSPARVAD